MPENTMLRTKDGGKIVYKQTKAGGVKIIRKPVDWRWFLFYALGALFNFDKTLML